MRFKREVNPGSGSPWPLSSSTYWTFRTNGQWFGYVANVVKLSPYRNQSNLRTRTPHAYLGIHVTERTSPSERLALRGRKGWLRVANPADRGTPSIRHGFDRSDPTSEGLRRFLQPSKPCGAARVHEGGAESHSYATLSTRLFHPISTALLAIPATFRTDRANVHKPVSSQLARLRGVPEVRLPTYTKAETAIFSTCQGAQCPTEPADSLTNQRRPKP